MRPLSANDLLRALDDAGARPADQGLAWLAAAWPEAAWEELAALPVGRRDARLLALYRDTFGPRLELWAACPGCGQDLDLALDADELLARAGEPADGESEAAAGDLTCNGFTVRFRALSGADLAAADRADGAEARRALAEQAVLAALSGGEPVPAAELPEEVVTQLAERLAALDPLAEVFLDLACPSCGHSWRPRLDVADCLEQELERAAHRLLEEVHALARGYGWREADVLAMSPRRRRLYLELLAR